MAFFVCAERPVGARPASDSSDYVRSIIKYCCSEWENLKMHQKKTENFSCNYVWTKVIPPALNVNTVIAIFFLMQATASRAADVSTVANTLRGTTFSGATIITHGYAINDDEGDYMMGLAQAIRTRITNEGGMVSLVDYDVTADGASAFIDDNQTTISNSGHLIFLFDWAPGSNEVETGWTEAAGDALFSFLVQAGLVNPRAGTGTDLHFIAHSFGSAVTSEAVERLAVYNIDVDHVTYLDPHDFDQDDVIVDIDGAQAQFELGFPVGYGASVWRNVAFTDVYYETRGSNDGSGIPDALIPVGRPIPGAYNRFLNEGEELPDLDTDPYPSLPLGAWAAGDHSYVFACFYTGTISETLPTNCPTQEIPTVLGSTGYHFSKVGGGEADRPPKTFFNKPSEPQDHSHTPDDIVFDNGTANPSGLNARGLTSTQMIQGGWNPIWNRRDIINGTFEHDGRLDIMPGWSHHGGGGSAEVNERLILNTNDEDRISNRLYVPHDATHLQFRLQRNNEEDNEVFEVRLGGVLLESYDLSVTDPMLITRQVPIPNFLRDSVRTISFRIRKDGTFASEVLLDDLQFVVIPEPGALALVASTLIPVALVRRRRAV